MLDPDKANERCFNTSILPRMATYNGHHAHDALLQNGDLSFKKERLDAVMAHAQKQVAAP